MSAANCCFKVLMNAIASIGVFDSNGNDSTCDITAVML